MYSLMYYGDNTRSGCDRSFRDERDSPCARSPRLGGVSGGGGAPPTFSPSFFRRQPLHLSFLLFLFLLTLSFSFHFLSDSVAGGASGASSTACGRPGGTWAGGGTGSGAGTSGAVGASGGGGTARAGGTNSCSGRGDGWDSGTGSVSDQGSGLERTEKSRTTG